MRSTLNMSITTDKSKRTGINLLLDVPLAYIQTGFRLVAVDMERWCYLTKPMICGEGSLHFIYVGIREIGNARKFD